jgi:hypothetical protein
MGTGGPILQERSVHTNKTGSLYLKGGGGRCLRSITPKGATTKTVVIPTCGPDRPIWNVHSERDKPFRQHGPAGKVSVFYDWYRQTSFNRARRLSSPDVDGMTPRGNGSNHRVKGPTNRPKSKSGAVLAILYGGIQLTGHSPEAKLPNNRRGDT